MCNEAKAVVDLNQLSYALPEELLKYKFGAKTKKQVCQCTWREVANYLLSRNGQASGVGAMTDLGQESDTGWMITGCVATIIGCVAVALMLDWVLP